MRMFGANGVGFLEATPRKSKKTNAYGGDTTPTQPKKRGRKPKNTKRRADDEEESPVKKVKTEVGEEDGVGKGMNGGTEHEGKGKTNEDEAI